MVITGVITPINIINGLIGPYKYVCLELFHTQISEVTSSTAQGGGGSFKIGKL